MTIQSAFIIIGICSVVTGLFTEGIKRLLDEKTRTTNLIALIVGLVVGVCVTFIWYGANGIAIDLMNIIYAICMGFASALGAMLGYDKITQAIEQIIGGGND